MAYAWHKRLEQRWIALTLATLAAVLVGGVVLLVPPFLLQGTIAPLPGLRPYDALELEGRDIYIREGCNTCHSQQVRPLKSETDRYGQYSLAGEGTYDRPFLWGSRRTGPDLARVGGKYPDSWHWLHLLDPRSIETRSNMPSFAFLSRSELDTSLTQRKLAALGRLGHPYSTEQIANAASDAQARARQIADGLRRDGIELDETAGRSEALALIAYLQSLGHAVRAGAVAQGS